MARNGSRAMMNDEEPGVVQLPRPAPISSLSDLAIPKLATLPVRVRSGICARVAGERNATTAQSVTKSKSAAICNLCIRLMLLLLSRAGRPVGTPCLFAMSQARAEFLVRGG